MKKLIIATLFSLGFAAYANAQISIQINIGNQPAWGPVGYDYARYYYLPAYNVYYDVNTSQFIYLRRNNWVYAPNLPTTYGRVDLYNTYKVVVNRNYAPYRDNPGDIRRYGNYRNMRSQAVIRDSRDNRYYQSKYHPMHQQWVNTSSRNKRSIAVNRNTHIADSRTAAPVRKDTRSRSVSSPRR